MTGMMRTLLAAGLVVFVITGCETQEEAAATADDPETLGMVGAQIHAEPERSDEILAEHGMTEDEFEERVWQVAEDPEASARYTSAMEEELDRLGVDRNGADPR